MVFNPNIPLSTDILSDSQVDLNNNNHYNNTWSSVDHYALDDMTPNNGFHSHVTSPTPATIAPAPGPVHYSTTLNPIFYGMNDTFTNINPNVIGNIQYSRGPNNAVPSPLTTKQSSSAALSGTSITILDFTGIQYCFGKVTVAGLANTVNFILLGAFFWPASGTGVTTFIVTGGSPTSGVSIVFSGALLNIISSFNITNAAWTLSFDRIWTPA